MKLLEYIDGHKTDFIQVIAIIATFVLWAGIVVGWWTPEQLELLPWIMASIWAPLTVMGIRDALRK